MDTRATVGRSDARGAHFFLMITSHKTDARLRPVTIDNEVSVTVRDPVGIKDRVHKLGVRFSRRTDRVQRHVVEGFELQLTSCIQIHLQY